MSILTLVAAIFVSVFSPFFKEHITINHSVEVCAGGACVDGGTTHR